MNSALALEECPRCEAVRVIRNKRPPVVKCSFVLGSLKTQAVSQ